MYRIIYSKGEMHVQVSTTAEGHNAHIMDAKNNIEAMIAGSNEDDVYYKCRAWASTNIYGEFMFEPIAIAS